MRRVGSHDAKTHLSKLLSEVQAGETILITRHGRPVAQLSPVKLIEFKARRVQIARPPEEHRKSWANPLLMDDMLVFRDDITV